MPVLKYRDPNTGIWAELSGTGLPGPAGAPGAPGAPGPTEVSIDPSNQATIGTDGLIYVPTVVGDITQPEADLLYVKLSGGTMAGALSVSTPTASAHAARKDYVDTKTANVSKVTVSSSAPAGPAVGDIWITP